LLLLQLLQLLLLGSLALKLQQLCLLCLLLLSLHGLSLLATHQVLLCVHLRQVAQLSSIIGLLQLLLQQRRLLHVAKLQALARTLLCCLLKQLLLQKLLLCSGETLRTSVLQLLQLIRCQQLCLPLVASKLRRCSSICTLVEQELVALCTSTTHQRLQVALHKTSVALQACISQLLLLLQLLLKMLLLKLLLKLLLLNLLLLLAQSKLRLSLLLRKLLLLLQLLLALQLERNLSLRLLSCLLLLLLLLLGSLRLQLLLQLQGLQLILTAQTRHPGQIVHPHTAKASSAITNLLQALQASSRQLLHTLLCCSAQVQATKVWHTSIGCLHKPCLILHPNSLHIIHRQGALDGQAIRHATCIGLLQQTGCWVLGAQPIQAGIGVHPAPAGDVKTPEVMFITAVKRATAAATRSGVCEHRATECAPNRAASGLLHAQRQKRRKPLKMCM
jgi:hypothetical protein